MTIIDLETALAKQQNDAPMQSQTRDRSDEPHKCTAQGQKPPTIEMFGKVHHCQLPLRLPAHQEQSQLVLGTASWLQDDTMWTPFWDSYESVIHRNPDLSDIDKFNY